MYWSDKDIEKLKKLVEEGYSHSEIGAKLGHSKNSVSGKIHRLNLQSKNKPGGKLNKDVTQRGRNKKVININKTSKPLPKEPPPPPKKIYKFRVRLPAELKDDKNFEKYWNDPNTPPINGIFDIPNKSECKWITGDLKDIKYGNAYWCRRPVTGTSNWCEYHRKLVYIPKSSYKDKTNKKGINT